jgi:hypothetical protein
MSGVPEEITSDETRLAPPAPANRSRKRRRRFSQRLQQKYAWARARRMATIVLASVGIVFLSSYLAGMSASTELKFLSLPPGLTGR